MKKQIMILVLLAVCLLSACQKDKKGEITEENNTPMNQVTNEYNQEEEDISIDETETVNLFDIKEYDGTTEINLQWGDLQSSAQFSKVPLLPFGLYIPTKMETYEFEDGNRWGYDQSRNYISILEFDDFYLKKIDTENKELKKYKEYVGSYQIETVNKDVFVFEKEQKKYCVELNYFEDERDIAIPMFLEVLKHMQYITITSTTSTEVSFIPIEDKKGTWFPRPKRTNYAYKWRDLMASSFIDSENG